MLPPAQKTVYGTTHLGTALARGLYLGRRCVKSCENAVNILLKSAPRLWVKCGKRYNAPCGWNDARGGAIRKALFS